MSSIYFSDASAKYLLDDDITFSKQTNFLAMDPRSANGSLGCVRGISGKIYVVEIVIAIAIAVALAEKYCCQIMVPFFFHCIEQLLAYS